MCLGVASTWQIGHVVPTRRRGRHRDDVGPCRRRHRLGAQTAGLDLLGQHSGQPLLQEGQLSTVDGLNTFPDPVHPDDAEPGAGQDRSRGQTDVPQPDDRDVDHFSSVSHESPCICTRPTRSPPRDAAPCAMSPHL